MPMEDRIELVDPLPITTAPNALQLSVPFHLALKDDSCGLRRPVRSMLHDCLVRRNRIAQRHRRVPNNELPRDIPLRAHIMDA